MISIQVCFGLKLCEACFLVGWNWSGFPASHGCLATMDRNFQFQQKNSYNDYKKNSIIHIAYILHNMQIRCTVYMTYMQDLKIRPRPWIRGPWPLTGSSPNFCTFHRRAVDHDNQEFSCCAGKVWKLYIYRDDTSMTVCIDQCSPRGFKPYNQWTAAVNGPLHPHFHHISLQSR